MFCSPLATVLSLPPILTSHCCLLHMSRLYTLSFLLVSSHAPYLMPSSFPLSPQSHFCMSQCPILSHPIPLCSSYIHLHVHLLYADSILSTLIPTATPTLTPTRSQNADSDKLTFESLLPIPPVEKCVSECHCRRKLQCCIVMISIMMFKL